MTGVIVAGMHRSGTSLITGFLEAGGWHPGEKTLAGSAEEYREDSSFVSIHRRWLENVLPDGNGHRDWGISNRGTVPCSFTADRASEMTTDITDFVSRRDTERQRWVAKDPRASLFLPLWLEHTESKCVFVYRNPWDVLDSAIRLGDSTFCAQPRLVLSAWLDYNNRIIDALTSHPTRCILIASENLCTNADSVWEALDSFIGISGNTPCHLVDPERFTHRNDQRAIASLFRTLYPQHWEVLNRLDQLATVPREQSCADDALSRTRSAHVTPSGSLPEGTGVQIIVPCKNDGDFLAEAIASVEESLIDDVELTIINDGSTDDETLRIFDALRLMNYEVITTPGVGLSQARNLATARSNTCAVLPLDADNRLHPPLLRAVKEMESNSVDIIHGPWKRFGVETGVVSPPEITMDNLVWGNTIDACALIRRDLLGKLGGWDSQLPFWEDWDLWLGAVEVNARVRKLDEVAIDYLVRSGSLSRTCFSDAVVHEQVVAHITRKHQSLLGPTISRLVREMHKLIGSFDDLQRHYQDLHIVHEQTVAHHNALHSVLTEQLATTQAHCANLESETAHLSVIIQAKNHRIARLKNQITALRSRKVVRFVDRLANFVRRSRRS